MKITDIDWSQRLLTIFDNAEIKTVYQLCIHKEQELLKYRNLGKGSLDEIKQKLGALGLRVGLWDLDAMIKTAEGMERNAQRIRKEVAELREYLEKLEVKPQ